ncbi:Hypothetical predicted protein [Mytilus galloprovincialis]|uniref:Uncharacterized protein n=1 Tax=Mytilus galloprovincialis TaxID=29158 RepID=A0A8B6EF41_MYTGA|nr:Hypothetical predicted protein [Mytilus galloprovincialis]VDI32780.1 Hypothetical predicted protein [Mytilus galloprovincialis]
MQDNRVHVTPTNVVVQTRESDTRPFDWTVPAFCVCCCCCWPLGVIAMVYASDANTAADHGDFEKAHKSATIAGVLTLASFLCGVGAIVALVVIYRT